MRVRPTSGWALAAAHLGATGARPGYARAVSAPKLPARIAEWTAGLLAVAAAVPVVRNLVEAMLQRRTYNGDIEWMEGGMLVSAMRARDGLPLYGLPADDYIPFIYPPLHAWLLGALAHVYPLGYELGRTVSIVCTGVAASALVFGAVRARGGWLLSLACVGLFASAWAAGGTFYDLVRTDSLSLALLGWALVLGAEPSRGATVASGLLLAVAFTAKQHAAILGLPMLLAIWRSHGRLRALQFAAASVGPALLFVAAMSISSGGTFLNWMVMVPAAHGQVASRAFPGAPILIWQALPISTSAVLLALPLWGRRPYWPGVTLTTLIVVALMRGHTGGFINVLIPAFWVSALLPAIAAGALANRTELLPWARAAGALVVAAQLTSFQVDREAFSTALAEGRSVPEAWQKAQHSLRRHVPTDSDRVAVGRVVEKIAALEGRVLVPYSPWYAVMAGKEPTFALICLWDIDHKRGYYRPNVKEIEKSIAAEFDWAVLPNDKLGHGLKDHFTKSKTDKIPMSSTRAGWTVRLREVWQRNPRTAGGTETGAKSVEPSADPGEGQREDQGDDPGGNDGGDPGDATGEDQGKPE